MLCYRCGSHVPDSAERCNACGQRQVGTARMPSTTGVRRRLSPALLAGAPYRIGDRMGDRYLVKDAIGIGPLGYVFRAVDEQQGIDVAVKMIHPRFVQTAEEREAFARAVEPARKFLQPSLARVHDLGVDQGWPYVTYSFLDGLTLRRMIDSRLAKGQTFTLDEVEPFLGQLAAALEAAHPLGAHADLKPENVVILPDMLRVVDWGLARGLPRLPFVQAQRQRSTHRYLAPEVVAGAEAEPRADLYALGVLVGEMLTGLTPEEDIPELRLTAPELPEAVEGFYRRALNERPEARFRSVRELYQDFLGLLAPQPGTTAAVQTGELTEVPEAAIEELEPLPEPAQAAADLAADAPPEASAWADQVEAEPAPLPGGIEPAAGVAPIPAAALPRFDGQGWEPQRPSSREVVALEPPAWTGASEAPAQPGSERWRSLRLWDADGSGPEEEAFPAPPEVAESTGRAASAEATGPELPLNTEPAFALVEHAQPPPERIDGPGASDEEAEHAVAGLTELAAVPESDGRDEPLLAEALGVDLVVEGDEPAPVRSAPHETAAETPREPPRVVPVPAPPPEAPSPQVTGAPARDAPRLVPDSRPWASEPPPPRYQRESPEAPRSGEAPVRHPPPPPLVPPVAVPSEGPAVVARSPLPSPPIIPPLRATVPRLAPVEPAARGPLKGTAPTPLSIVPEPAPTKQEPVVVPLPMSGASGAAAPAGAGRGAGAWSPSELLAQVISEVRTEEQGIELPPGTSWQPVPLDATQPISTEEVAARVAAETAREGTAGVASAPAATGVFAPEPEDLPALRHEAGRAGMRMALLISAGLIMGMLAGWSAMKVLSRAPRPQAEHISDAQPRG